MQISNMYRAITAYTTAAQATAEPSAAAQVEAANILALSDDSVTVSSKAEEMYQHIADGDFYTEKAKDLLKARGLNDDE